VKRIQGRAGRKIVKEKPRKAGKEGGRKRTREGTGGWATKPAVVRRPHSGKKERGKGRLMTRNCGRS